MMVKNVSIIPIHERHIAGFRDALDLVAREGNYLVFSEAPPLESVSEFVKGNIKDNGIQLVAVDDDDVVVGWIDILRGNFAKDQHVGRLGMAIVPDWRGRGLGRKLISAALSRAEDSDLELVQLNVFESNQRALKLYEEFGFSREGLRSNAWKINGELINDIPMSRPLKTRKRKI